MFMIFQISCEVILELYAASLNFSFGEEKGQRPQNKWQETIHDITIHFRNRHLNYTHFE